MESKKDKYTLKEIGSCFIIILFLAGVILGVYKKESKTGVEKEIYSGDYIIKARYSGDLIYYKILNLNTPDSIICQHIQSANSAIERAKYLENFQCK